MSKEGMTAVLQVEGLRKAFGGVQAVYDVSFAIEAGELLALIGPNGAGKSTCFKHAETASSRLTPASCGWVAATSWLEAARHLAAGRRRTFQITPPSLAIVRENVQMALYSHARRLHSLLSRFGAQPPDGARPQATMSRPPAHDAGVRRELAVQHVEAGALAAPLGPISASSSPASMAKETS